MNEIDLKILSLQGGRKENQDSYGARKTKVGHLIVVCDGMGGAKGGATASELAVRTVIEMVENTQLTDTAAILTDAISSANQRIFQMGKAIPELSGMGTTAVALIIDDEKATSAHVGDSRIYQIRGSRKIFRTFDHSMVFELVKRKTISEEQARLSAESNVILRALGTKPEIEVEINKNLPYLKGDRFLLCTDGICGAVSEQELIKLINCKKSIDVSAETIVNTIDRIGNETGGKHDNLTAALLQVKTNSKIKPKMDKKSKIIVGILAILLLASIIFIALQGTSISDKNLQINTLKNEKQNLDLNMKNLNDSIRQMKSGAQKQLETELSKTNIPQTRK